MSKYYGKVGYATCVDRGYGVYEDTIIERQYYGDTIKVSSRWQNSGGVNDDLTINFQVSILADPFAYENFSHIKYVEVMGSLWKVTNIDPAYPRITLTVGGPYTGQLPESEAT